MCVPSAHTLQAGGRSPAPPQQVRGRSPCSASTPFHISLAWAARLILGVGEPQRARPPARAALGQLCLRAGRSVLGPQDLEGSRVRSCRCADRLRHRLGDKGETQAQGQQRCVLVTCPRQVTCCSARHCLAIHPTAQPLRHAA